MKKIFVSLLVLMGAVSVVNGAEVSARRSQTNVVDKSATTGGAESAVSARSAVATRSATSQPAQNVSARSATTGRTTVSRSATTTSSTPSVTARAATTTKGVISTGTKVATATKNIAVSEECQLKYEGCMDSFCMLDNTTGGRCICSDKNAELNSILAEIEKLDQQSYQMATVGVERIEMGDEAQVAIDKANEIASSILTETEKEVEKPTLDLSLWDTPIEFSEETIFTEEAFTSSPVENKEGDALYRAATGICIAQIPECAGEISMLQLMYAQRVRSDCNAYENSLKQQRNASANKLAVAEKALRDAALEQYRTANKYDLGQCTTEFKKCMMSTGGCGDDFAGCVGIAAAENAKNVKTTIGGTAKQYTIKGSATQISIAASTYDALLAKKPLCEYVTKSCVAVQDQVWDTFLRDVAPQVKTAELNAESDLRMSCISNISECFQKACRDTMDPNDPEGSYDLCLSRPETVESLCKVQIEPCQQAEPMIMDFVRAKLASMRVDACTEQVKNCLQSDDLCGEDYVQCVGLDTDTIIRMCPLDKLTACQQKYSTETDENKNIVGDAIYDELATMVQGIMLNIDNNMITLCQRAADEAMINVCGDTESCTGLTVDENVGAMSLKYDICNSSNSSCVDNVALLTEDMLRKDTSYYGRMSGIINWGAVGVDEDGKLTYSSSLPTTFSIAKNLTIAKGGNTTSVSDSLLLGKQLPGVASDSIASNGLSIVKSDLPVLKADTSKVTQSDLVNLQRNIDLAVNAIESDPTVQFCMTGREVQGIKTSVQEERSVLGGKGKEYARFPELTTQMRQIIASAALNKAMENYRTKYDELMDDMAKDYVTISTKIAQIEQKDSLEDRREVARVACLTLGLRSSIVADGTRGNVEVPSGYVSSSEENTKKYKETVTATFAPETLVCRKCVRALIWNDGNDTWDEPAEKCTDIQF